MAKYFTHDLIIHIIIFQMGILLIICSNILILHRARRHSPPLDYPMVSILIPARNEEKKIGRCIQSLLAQDYPNFEVIVLDDQSSDSTFAVLEGIFSSQPNLKVLTGSAPPEGQVGKNWACVQLAQAAQGDLLFFTDADTIHRPATLRAIVTALIGEQADLLTGFPRQEMRTWTERLLVPFFTWSLICFTPLWLAYRARLPALSNAVGQMMLFRRESYKAIGGHASVGSSIVDDLMLAKGIKAAGLRWRVVHISDLITCRMYDDSHEAFNGFTKNYFAVFSFHVLPYLFVFIWLAVMFWEPLIVAILLASGRAQQAQLGELVSCIGLSLLLWLIPYLEMGVPLGLALCYPFTILANEAIAFQSLRLSLSGRITWKGRALARPKWKWL